MSSDDLEALYAVDETPATPLATDGELVAKMLDLVDLRTEKEVLEARLKVVNELLRNETGVILATYDARGWRSMVIDTPQGQRTLYITETPHPRVVDRVRWLGYLDFIGQPELAPRTTNYQTLRAWWKERLARGASLPPPEIAEAFNDRRLMVRKKN